MHWIISSHQRNHISSRCIAQMKTCFFRYTILRSSLFHYWFSFYRELAKYFFFIVCHLLFKRFIQQLKELKWSNFMNTLHLLRKLFKMMIAWSENQIYIRGPHPIMICMCGSTWAKHFLVDELEKRDYEVIHMFSGMIRFN